MPGIAALAFAYVLSQFYRTFLAVLTPVLTAEIGLTKADLSLASGLFFLSFALAQFGVGVSLDRFGPRRTAGLTLGIAGGAGAFLFASATQPWMVAAAMLLLGLACAPVLMGSLFIFARMFPPARFAVLASWMVAFGSAGNVIGASPMAHAAQAFGWRPVMAGLGVMTILVASALLALVKDPPPPEGQASGDSGLRGYIDLLKLRHLWPIIPITAVNYAPALGIRGLWTGPYLSEVFGADSLAIGDVTFYMALSMVAGAFVYGPLDTFFKTRKWVGVAGNLIGVAALAWLAAHIASGLGPVTLALVAVGLAGGGYGLFMAHARAFFPPHLVGRGVTLMNFFNVGGIAVLLFATGAVVTANADPANPSGAYVALFAFYAALLAASIAIYLFSRDARPGGSAA